MIEGIDVSKWQGLMEWFKAKSAGAQYAFIRAGSISIGGTLYTDYQFERNAEIAPDFMPVGFYWYYRPQYDPVAQADYFCNLIKDKRDKLPPVLDLENKGGTTHLSPAYITDSAARFVLRVNENLGVLPILYSRGAWLNANTVPDDFMKLLDLWVARYTNKSKPWGNLFDWKSINPRDYDDWKFWQWSADGNGRGPEFGAKSKSIDLNRFNGDQVAFDEYVGKDNQPEMKDIYIEYDGQRLVGHVKIV